MFPKSKTKELNGYLINFNPLLCITVCVAKVKKEKRLPLLRGFILKVTTRYAGYYCSNFDAGVSTEPAEKRLQETALDGLMNENITPGNIASRYLVLTLLTSTFPN